MSLEKGTESSLFLDYVWTTTTELRINRSSLNTAGVAGTVLLAINTHAVNPPSFKTKEAFRRSH
jgi:hypothetical protein